MNLNEIGQKIKYLRLEADLTQKELADMLSVTDKAVSKWERGIGFPETSIFHKMSKVLDFDMDFVLTSTKKKNVRWHGLIIYNSKICLNALVHDKPIINYLLQYFMLVGIKNISFKTDDIANKRIIDNYNFSKFGLKIDCDNDAIYNNLMVLYEPILLFGANLTRYFETCMENEKNICLSLGDKKIPIAFTHDKKFFRINSKFEKCNLTRGIISLPLNNKEDIKNASCFIKIYQDYHRCKIADLSEIAKNRGLI